jgi:hypothetical protein
MNSIQEIAQWVIDNRSSKSKKEKISDLEIYHTIVDGFYNLSIATEKEPCEKCQWIELIDKTAVCKVCGTQSPF